MVIAIAYACRELLARTKPLPLALVCTFGAMLGPGVLITGPTVVPAPVVAAIVFHLTTIPLIFVVRMNGAIYAGWIVAVVAAVSLTRYFMRKRLMRR